MRAAAVRHELKVATLVVVICTAFSARAAVPEDPTWPVREGYRLTKEKLRSPPGASRRRIAEPWVPPHRDELFSRRMASLWETDARYWAATHEMGNIDIDPFTLAQDAEKNVFNDLAIDIVAREGGRAEVRARFTNFKPVDVRFDVVLEDGRWVIDDIRGMNLSVAGMLAQPHLCADGWTEPCRAIGPRQSRP